MRVTFGFFHFSETFPSLRCVLKMIQCSHNDMGQLPQHLRKVFQHTKYAQWSQGAVGGWS